MEIKAQLRFLRLPPRKVRAILNVIRGLSIKEAEAQLLLFKKRAAQPVLKLLYSAIANAKNTFSLRKEDLQIKRIEAQEGPTLHRWFPRAFGRAAPIRKKSSHLLIVLEPQKGVSVVKKIETTKLQKPKEESKTEVIEEAKEKKETVVKKEEKIKKVKKEAKTKREKGFVKRIFSRKAI